MKSFVSSRGSSLNALMTLCALGLTTFSLPAIADPQEACVKTSAGDVVCGTPVPNSPRSSQPTIETTIDSQTVYGVTWELKSCVRGTGNLVSCTLVLSSDMDQGLGLYPSQSKLVDGSGNEYIGSKVQIGKKADRNVVSITMAKGASYRAIFNFPNVPTSVSQAVLFQISEGGSFGSPYIKFRNVPIN